MPAWSRRVVYSACARPSSARKTPPSVIAPRDGHTHPNAPNRAATLADLAAGSMTIGGPDGILTQQQIHDHILESLATMDFDGKSVALVVPDGTRSVPMHK